MPDKCPTCGGEMIGLRCRKFGHEATSEQLREAEARKVIESSPNLPVYNVGDDEAEGHISQPPTRIK